MGNPPGFFQGTEMPDAGWWESLWPDPAAVLGAVGVKPGAETVDLCCGDGWFTLQLAKIARHVLAVDIDPALLKIAQTRLAESGVSKCEYLAGDACELAMLAPRPFDLVFMANAFHGVPDRSRLARAVHETLKPGGRFAIVNWHRRPREETVVLGEPRGPQTDLRLSPGATIEAVASGGLRPAGLVELPPYHYTALFERPAP